MTEPTTVTLAAFARLRSVSKAAVTKWKAQGLLVLVDGKVDVAASVKLLSERAPPARGGRPRAALLAELSASGSPGNPSETWTTAEAVRRERIAVAKLRQIEADRAAGLVVPIAEVEGAVRGEFAIVRATLLGIASKIAHRLAVASTPEACGSLVEVEVRAALEALTRDAAP